MEALGKINASAILGEIQYGHLRKCFPECFYWFFRMVAGVSWGWSFNPGNFRLIDSVMLIFLVFSTNVFCLNER